MLLKTISRFERQCRSDLRGRDDRWLVTAAQNGDSEAFEVLVQRYQRVVLSIGLRSTRNQEDAEDVAQQTFLKAFVHLRKFRGTASFSTWLVRIALNESLMLCRKSWRAREVSLDKRQDDENASFFPETEDQGPNPEESYRLEERRSILLTQFRSLTPATRSVLKNYDLDDRSVKETAALLKISVSAVKSRTSRGRAILRRKTEQYFRPASGAVDGLGRGSTARAPGSGESLSALPAMLRSRE